MNYLLFNKGVLISDGTNVRRIDNDIHLKDNLGGIDEARICVVDVDVLIAASVESPIEKKDSILVRKFNELYQHEAYVIQDEKIDNNLFQVIGIKEQRLREIYSILSPELVEFFIPYGIALRAFLINKRIDLNKTIVFVDDMGDERLLTVFDGLKFSRTRVIANNGENILPEIKRSQIDFFKKTGEYSAKKNTDFTIVVNNGSLAAEISGNEDKLPVECLKYPYPALEGLKEINTPIKYRLPEEIFKKRKEIEFKKNVTTAVLSLCVAGFGLFYFLVNKIELKYLCDRWESLRGINEQLDDQLSSLDHETYREDLKNHKYLNYAVCYLTILDLIPASYQVDSFEFNKAGKWDLILSLSTDTDGILDAIPRVKILKRAAIKDIYVNNQPGKRLEIIL